MPGIDKNRFVDDIPEPRKAKKSNEEIEKQVLDNRNKQWKNYKPKKVIAIVASAIFVAIVGIIAAILITQVLHEQISVYYHVGNEVIERQKTKGSEIEQPSLADFVLPQGQEFDGWYKDSSKQIEFSFGEKAYGEVHMYMKTKLMTIPISFGAEVPNGCWLNDFSYSEASQIYGSYFKLPEAKPTINNKNYNFVGWKYNGEIYQPGDTIQITSTSFINFTAVWEGKPLLVSILYSSYDAVDDGYQTIDNETLNVKYGDKLVAPTINVNHKEHTKYFAGYCVEGVGGGVVYKPGEIITNSVSANMEIGLVWKDSTNVLALKNGVEQAFEFNYITGYKFYLPAIPNDARLTFLYWKDGTNIYKTDELFTMPEGAKTLQAVFANSDQTILLNANGGYCTSEQIKVAYTNPFVLPQPSKDFYNFVCWNTNANGSGTSYDAGVSYIAKFNTFETELYAIWQKKSYPITFNLAGGESVVSTSASVEYDSAISFITATREYYSLEGWQTTNALGNSVVYSVSENVLLNTSNFSKADIENGITLTAVWAEKPVDVVLKLEGAVARNVPSGWKYNKTDVAHCTLTKTINYLDELSLPNFNLRINADVDMQFDGWQVVKNNANVALNGAISATEANITKTGDKYSIELELKISEVTKLYFKDLLSTESTLTAVAGNASDSILLNNTPVKEGYEFVYWVSEKPETPTSTKYYLNDRYTFTQGAQFLYAKFVKLYTVNFANNNAESTQTPTAITMKEGSECTLPVLDNTANFVFNGWTDGTNNYAVNANFNFTSTLFDAESELTLTAVWKNRNVKVVYNYNNGTNTTAEQLNIEPNATRNLIFPTSPAVEWEHHELVGWFTSSSATDSDTLYTESNKSYNFGTTDVQLYAIWKDVEYSVNYNLAGGTFAGSTTQKVVYGNEFTTITPTRENYDFVGWQVVDVNGQVITIEAEQNVELSTTLFALNDIKAGITLTASWQGHKVAVNFVVENGGNVANLNVANITALGYSYNEATHTISTTNTTQATFGNTYNLPNFNLSEDTTHTYNIVGWRLGETTHDLLGSFVVSASNTTGEEGSLVATLTIVFQQVSDNKLYLVYTDGDTRLIMQTAGSTYTLPAGEKEGYRFSKWVENPESVVNEYNAGDVYTFASGTTTTLVAIYNRLYTVNFSQSNGESVSVDSASGIAGEVLTLPTLADTTNYKFLGWSYENNGETISNTYAIDATNFDASANVRLYAVWQNKYVTVTYYHNNGTGTSTETMPANTVVDLHLPIVGHVHHNLLGWWTTNNPTADDVLYTYENRTFSFGLEDVELWAIWKENNYDVNYVLNGGTTTSPTTESVAYGHEFTTITASKENYTFVGWQTTTASGGTKLYSAGEKVALNNINFAESDLISGITLTAIWQGDAVAVVWELSSDGIVAEFNAVSHLPAGYNYNSSTKTITSTNTTLATFGSDYTIPSFELSCDTTYTYKVIGWLVAGTNYGLTDSLTVGSENTTGTAGNLVLTIKIVFTPTTNSLTLVNPLGENETIKHTAGYVYTLPTLNVEGYEFVEWQDSDSHAYTSETYTFVEGEQYTLTAVFAKLYTLYFGTIDNDECTQVLEAITKTEGSVITLPTLNDTSTYAFVGWKKDGESSTIANTFTFAQSTFGEETDITLYSVWQHKTTTITYVYHNGSTPGTSTQGNVLVNATNTLNLPAVENEHYNLLGWWVNTTPAETDTLYSAENSTISVGTTAVELHAIWQPKTYILTYNSNDATESTQIQSIQYLDSSKKVLDCPFSLAGHRFIGWATTATGEVDETYGVGQPISLSADLQLYAVWEEIPYRHVNYYSNNVSATGTMENETYEQNNIITIKPNAFALTGYHFIGWATSEGGSVDANYAPGTTMTIINNINLYAVWEENVYTVNFVNNASGDLTFTGDAVSNINVLHTVGSIELPTCNWDRENYFFVGWSVYEDASADSANTLTPGTTITGIDANRTYYAVWAEATRIIFSQNGGTFKENAIKSIKVYANKTYTGVLPNDNVSLTNYKLIGWDTRTRDDQDIEITNPTYQLNTEVSINVGSSPITLYAIWDVGDKKIYFVANCANYGYVEGEPEETKIVQTKYLSTITLPECPYTREDHIFVAWNTSADGSGTEYLAGTSYQAVFSTLETTLYAQWLQNLYHITSTSDLITKVAPNSEIEGITYVQDNDFALTESVCLDTFAGTYNGNGKTITCGDNNFNILNNNGQVNNLTLSVNKLLKYTDTTNSKTCYTAFVGNNSGTLAGVKVKATNDIEAITNSTYVVAMLSIYNTGTISACGVEAQTIKATCSIGGLVWKNSGTINAVGGETYFEGNIVVSVDNSGGIVATNEGEGCIVGVRFGKEGTTYSITPKSSSITLNNVGGIVGNILGGYVQNCTNYANITLNKGNYVGGISGDMECAGSIIGCTNYGTISTESSNVCGISGNYSGSGSITDCINYGDIHGTNKVGGITHCVSKSTAITNCTNYGDLYCTGSSVGGIGSIILNTSSFGMTVTNCTNHGNIYAENSTNVGGILGECSSNLINITDCTNRGSIIGKACVGGIVGCSNTNGGNQVFITNCNNYGTITSNATSEASKIGGIAGEIQNSITNCANYGTISAPYANNVGGIVGYKNRGDTTDCTNYGSITGKEGVGGIVGYLKKENYVSKIENCTNSAENNETNTTISGYASVGGIVGSIEVGSVVGCTNFATIVCIDDDTETTRACIGGIAGKTSVSLSNCVNKGVVNAGNAEKVGGFAGQAVGTLESKIYIYGTNHGSITGKEWVGGIVGYATYTNMDSNNTNIADIKYSYNYGRVVATYDIVGGIVGYADNSNIRGSKNNASITGRFCVGGIVGYADNSFIRGSTNNASITGRIDVGGIVGSAVNSSIYTCTNSESCSTETISGEEQVGGIVGYMNDSSIESCTNYSSVSGNIYIGGIVGRTSGGSIQDCVNGESSTTNVSGQEQVGGIVGYVDCASVDGCLNYMSIQSSNYESYTGGIIGNAYDSSITDCENYGSVEGGGILGGIVGFFHGSDSAISYCVNNGQVDNIMDCDCESIGGIVGLAEGCYSNIIGCVNNGDVNTINAPEANKVGGIVGYCQGEYSEISDCTNYGSVAGHDYVGGIVGHLLITVYENTPISNCTNSVEDNETNTTISGFGGVGGIVGYAEAGVVENCTNYAEIHGTEDGNTDCWGFGGIAGKTNDWIVYCVNDGLIYVPYAEGVAGIAGQAFGGGLDYRSWIYASFNCSAVTGRQQVGGMVGYGMFVYIMNCGNYDYGTINAVNAYGGSCYAGGIAGQIYGSIIRSCLNRADVYAEYYAGGIGGQIGGTYNENDNTEVFDCYNVGNISGYGHIGGIAGYMGRYGDWGGALYRVYNNGVVQGGWCTGLIVGESETYVRTVCSGPGNYALIGDYSDLDGIDTSFGGCKSMYVDSDGFGYGSDSNITVYMCMYDDWNCFYDGTAEYYWVENGENGFPVLSWEVA